MIVQSVLARVETVSPKITTPFILHLNYPTPIDNPLCGGPHGQKMVGPLAWEKHELSEGGYIHLLSEEHIQECNKAMRGFLG